MDDATQKLIDEAAREWLMGYYGSVDTTALLLAFKAGSRWRPPVSENVRDLVDDLRESAAQSYDELSQATIDVLNRAADYISRPPVSVPYVTDEGTLHRHSYGEECNYLSCRPVSPEAREAMRAVVGEQLTKAGLDLDGPPYSDDGETQWPVALELRDRLADAILARFAVPSQPVYDEEAIARWLAYVASDWTHDDCGDDDHPFGHTNWQAWLDDAAAFVAALRGGELTREETNE